MRSVLLIFCYVCQFQLEAQTSTEVYLYELIAGEEVSISNPVNISDNPGYDNQPHFLPDGKTVVFSATRNDQTDIAAYSIKKRSTNWITNTPGSEYSPTPIPGKKKVSSILLEKDGTQLLWSYPIQSKGEPSILVPGLKIGYHCWLDQSTLFAFVLGTPPKLVRISMDNVTESETLAEKIGRSLHKIPNKSLISYVDKSTTPFLIKALNPVDESAETITEVVGAGEDMAWIDENTLLMGRGSELMVWKKSVGWRSVKDLNKGEITRISVSPNKRFVAIVVSE
jgi:hypothetical protein